MRSRRKEWKNGTYPKWTARIIWFQGNDDIRLELEDCERVVNVYPKSKEDADHMWFMFRQGAPQEGDKTPFVADLLKLFTRMDSTLTSTEDVKGLKK